MSKTARNISGSKRLAKSHSQATMKKFRDNAAKHRADRSTPNISKTEKTRLATKRSMQAKVNEKRPVAQLRGFFRYNTESYCKHYSKEEIAALNKERNKESTKPDKINPYELFDEEEMNQIAKEEYNKDMWLNKDFKRCPLKRMGHDYITRCMSLIETKGNDICWGNGYAWHKKFTAELERRKVNKK